MIYCNTATFYSPYLQDYKSKTERRLLLYEFKRYFIVNPCNISKSMFNHTIGGFGGFGGFEIFEDKDACSNFPFIQ